MSAELPPQIQNQVAQLQQLQQQAQALAVQRSQLELSLNEANQVKEELAEKKETFDVRLKSLQRQEERVQTRFQQLQQQLQKALGGGTVPQGA
jgi:prefoldin beta subunit